MKIDSKCPATNFVIPTFMRHPQQLADKGGNIYSCFACTRLYKPVLPSRWNSCFRLQPLAKPTQTAIVTVHICLRGLEEDALYRVESLHLYGTTATPENGEASTERYTGAVYSGSTLMYAGCTLPQLSGDYPSVQLHLTRATNH